MKNSAVEWNPTIHAAPIHTSSVIQSYTGLQEILSVKAGETPGLVTSLSLGRIKTKTIHTRTHTHGQFRFPTSTPMHIIVLWEGAEGLRGRTHTDTGNTCKLHTERPPGPGFSEWNHASIIWWSEWQCVANSLAEVPGKKHVLVERTSWNAHRENERNVTFLNRASYFLSMLQAEQGCSNSQCALLFELAIGLAELWGCVGNLYIATRVAAAASLILTAFNSSPQNVLPPIYT